MDAAGDAEAGWQGAVREKPGWSDAHGELVERYADPVMGGDVGGELVVPRRRFWTNACPAARIRADRWRMSPRIGRSRAFSRPSSVSTELFAYRPTVCSAEGISSSRTRG
jgi:hypothetical protein